MTSDSAPLSPYPSQEAGPAESAPRTASRTHDQESPSDDGVERPPAPCSDTGSASPESLSGALADHSSSNKRSAYNALRDKQNRSDVRVVRPVKTRGPRFEALESAIEELKRIDPTFTGTMYAIAKRMRGVGHQRVVNLIEGQTRPWAISAHTMFELLRVFRECGSLKASNFMMPKEDLWQK